MEELGLAENAVRQKTSDPVMEVIMMLRQGATPEELIQGGVPAALIEQAIAIIKAEIRAMEPKGPDVMADPNAGLAAKLNGGAMPNRSTII